MIYLTLREPLYIAERAIGSEPVVRDHGLLESALARPRATVFGRDAYPTLDGKAAALLHSLARDHALIDGNKRLALAGLIAFYGLNGRRLTLTNDEAYDLVMNIASGLCDAVEDITKILEGVTRDRGVSRRVGLRSYPSRRGPHSGHALRWPWLRMDAVPAPGAPWSRPEDVPFAGRFCRLLPTRGNGRYDQWRAV
ncbi:death on curing protein [Frankia sp. Hr75.2]|nr:death on curing protein [Frankia sp. Hr75.2]